MLYDYYLCVYFSRYVRRFQIYFRVIAYRCIMAILDNRVQMECTKNLKAKSQHVIWCIYIYLAGILYIFLYLPADIDFMLCKLM